MVTTMKVKNMSRGAIALLIVDEYWYDKSKTPKIVTGDQQRWRKPFNPGEIIDLTFKAPINGADLYQSQYSFSHANGKVDAKTVKKFTE